MIMLKISEDSIDDLYKSLGSGVSGLTHERALEKLREQQKSEKKETRFVRELKLFVRQFTNPLMLLLIVAVSLSAALGQSSDTIIISFILLGSGLMGFFQELQAGRAVEKLQQIIKLKSLLIRDGKEQEINADEIVAGDIIKFNAGDIIPADCRIIDSNELHVNESVLTGESYPAEKLAGTVNETSSITEKHNCLWKGTNIISGTATVIAVYTGADSTFGKIQKSVLKQTETAFEKNIKNFGFFILQITIVLSLFILGVNIYFKKPLFDSILFSLAIAVGMAPELLPAVMTFALSAGAKRMMKKKVIVKKLSSIFNFGEVNVLCTDKTGTITEGIIQVKDMVNAYGVSDERLKKWAYLNASMQNGFNNPIDEAIVKLNIPTDGYKKEDEIPYDFIRKRLSILVSNNNQFTIITKGAVLNILSICSHFQNDGDVVELNDDERNKIETVFKNYGEQGYRAIGICRKEHSSNILKKEDEKDMVFLDSFF